MTKFVYYFFFSSRRRHTRLQGDWSSDVCSSDLTPFPIAVALGADPATTLGAVTPVPDSLSEYQFAGLLREIGRASCRERGESWEVAASRVEEGEATG